MVASERVFGPRTMFYVEPECVLEISAAFGLRTLSVSGEGAFCKRDKNPVCELAKTDSSKCIPKIHFSPNRDLRSMSDRLGKQGTCFHSASNCIRGPSITMILDELL